MEHGHKQSGRTERLERRRRDTGAAGGEHLAVLAAVGLTGLAAFVAVGGAWGSAIGGASEGASPTGGAHAGGVAVASEAGTAGALARLAEAGLGDEVAAAARQAAYAEQVGGPPPDLGSAARAVFGGHANSAVVRTWGELLERATEGHAAFMTEFAASAGGLLAPKHLARLLQKARAVDLHIPFEFGHLSVAETGDTFARVLAPFGSRQRLRLLETLAEKHLGIEVSDLRRFAVAADPDSRPEALARLLEDESLAIRRQAGRNPSLPEAEVYLRMRDPDPLIRAIVAGNPQLTTDWVQLLLLDDDVRVRRAAASNPSASHVDLGRLASSPDPEMRRSVARNPSTPGGVIAGLAFDTDKYVVLDAAGHRALPESIRTGLAGHPETLVRDAVARSPYASDYALRHLASDETRGVRLSVAGNPSASAAVLTKLASDDAAIVRQAVAVHPKTPAEVRARLAADEIASVRGAAARFGAPPPPERLVSSPIPRLVDLVRVGHEQGLTVPPAHVRAWEDLPTGDPDLARHPGLMPDAGRVDGARFVANGVEHEVRVLRSKAAVREYQSATRDYATSFGYQGGDADWIPAVIVATDAPDAPLYRVQWGRGAERGDWRLSSASPGKRRPIESRAVNAAIERLTERLNGARPGP